MRLSDSTLPEVPVVNKSKIFYIDHLKVFLTAIVVLHHACVTYGAPGGWYYSEKTLLSGAIIPMTTFVAINQSYFMGFFFFLSALFLPSSYDKKGAALFIKDRLFRFALPILFYSFMLSPVINYLVYYFAGGHHITFLQFVSGYDNWISFGVLWFVVALLLLTSIYVIWRLFFKPETSVWAPPSVNAILVFAALLGVLSFIVRLVFPVGWVLEPFGFQPGHFPQYIALFVFGIVAANYNWLGQIDFASYRKFSKITFRMIAFGLPGIFAFKIITKGEVEWYSGGLHIQSFLYAFWEQVTGISIIAALLCFAKQRWNKSSALLVKLSRCSFAVYILHPFVLVSLSILVRTWHVDPSVKVLFVAPLGVIFSFLLGYIVVRIPGVNTVV